MYAVCVGLATCDTVLAVARYPAPDEVVAAGDVAVAGGGPAATAAVTLARLGVPTHFVGAVGDDDTGAFIRDGLEREGVDLSELVVVAGARSPQSAVFVTAGTRTIAAFRGDLAVELSPRALELCQGAAWVHVDQTGYAAIDALRGHVKLSLDGGNEIEGIDLRGVELYAPTERALRRDFGTAQAALEAGARLVVVTRGEEGCVAYTADGEVAAPGSPIQPVSTLGAGDVFHGALLAQLIRDAPLGDALGFANACAALSCRALDGRSAIPTVEELTR